MSALRKGWCPGALRPMPAKDGLLVRLRITGGILPAATARTLADLAERCGNGLFDLSSRGNLQMRGVRDEALRSLQDGLLSLDLLDDEAAGEAVRNVLASPLAGLHDSLDIRPLTQAMETRLVADDRLHALPPKFGFLVDDGSTPSLADVAADVRFDWTGDAFAIGLGGTREKAAGVGTCAPDELVDRAAALACYAAVLFTRHPDARRVRGLIEGLGVDRLLRAWCATPSPACGRRWPDEVGSDEGTWRRAAMVTSPSFRHLPHPTSADAEATFSRKREKDRARSDILELFATYGRLNAAMLRSAANVAATTRYGELRLTPWRAILVPGASDADIPGFITDKADPRLRVAACVGMDGCAQGTTRTRTDAERLAAHLGSPGTHDIVLHVSGCAKGCAKASPSPVTLVARDGLYDLVRDGRAGDDPTHTRLTVAQARALLAAAPEPA